MKRFIFIILNLFIIIHHFIFQNLIFSNKIFIIHFDFYLYFLANLFLTKFLF